MLLLNSLHPEWSPHLIHNSFSWPSNSLPNKISMHPSSTLPRSTFYNIASKFNYIPITIFHPNFSFATNRF